MEEFNDFNEMIEFEQAKLNVDKIINAKQPKKLDNKACLGIGIVLTILLGGILVGLVSRLNFS